MNATQENADHKAEDEPQSVAGRVLHAFIDVLAARPGYEDIAARLKTEIIDKQSTSEAALRRALFDENSQ